MAYQDLTDDQLRKLVAERVFRLRKVTGSEVPEPHNDAEGEQEAWVDAEGRQVYCRWCGDMPDWPNDEGAAWQVVNEMSRMRFAMELLAYPDNMVDVQFIKFLDEFNRRNSRVMSAKRASRAICLAAVNTLEAMT